MLGMQDDISDIELKQRWRLYWIQCIFEFSNVSLQKAAWIEDPETNPTEDEVWSSSFDACNAAYFDNLDLYDGYAKAVERGNVTQEEAKRAEVFHRLAISYIEPDEAPEAILQDPEWLEVTEAAKTFWDYLKMTLTSQRELDLIRQLEKDFS